MNSDDNEDVIDMSVSVLKKKKQSNSQGEGKYYQRFEINLDRTYRDRDKELCNKLMRT